MSDKEFIEYMKADMLVPFKDHPFKMRDGDEKEQLLESIKTQGAIEPLIVRSSSEGKYEIISGHRRLAVCKELGIDNIPVIVHSLTDEQAVSMMVDANIHRESILPSEQAFAYKMKLEALKKQGYRSDLTFSQVAKRLNNSETIAEGFGISKDTLHRYIRLTELIPELLGMVDDGRIALTPAVELSYLTKEQQQHLVDEIEYTDATPSLSQAQRLRSLSRQGHLGKDAIYVVMSEEKANQKEQVRFAKEDIQKYFPKNYTSKDMSEVIVKLLENWQRKRERNSREER
ncbi:ParB/RepB/Spo0J family partition protein [Clostridiaceae bacterium DONG20-135]|uniref:ParB/RepB/Spo0J family partition protein n=1 Tax=Copranaerobaculum intestinale TaxID=2692629 RepID=A0A6N8U4D2_9FIRM|nr:ParB/RepB/Spo0J family partition protein [Copranaerobaculum intestinale]MXQ73058.1 ParB/RepB/Spo0J family partition protein [Copranaerobaculum intestinale]